MVRKLLYLNGLAAISVVFYHSALWGYAVMFYAPPIGEPNFNRLGSADYFGLLTIDQLVIFAIPAFIFVSGYFMTVATAQSNKTIEWNAVLNRVKLLIIPFLIWSVLNLLFKMWQGDQYAPFDFFLRVVTGRVAPRFYFSPLLIQLYILAPLLVLLARRQAKTVLATTAIIQIVVLLSRYVNFLHPDWVVFDILSSKRFFSAYVFWFVLGIVVGLNLAHVKTILARYKMLFLIGAFIFFLVGVVEGDMLFRRSGGIWRAETLIDQAYSLFVILTFLAYEKIRFPLVEQISGLGIRSYGIYLTHTFALTSIIKVMERYMPSVMVHQIVLQPILIFSGLAFPLLLMYFVQKTPLNKYYRYLFG